MKKILFSLFILHFLFINNFAIAQVDENNNNSINSSIPSGSYPAVKDQKIVKALDSLINTDGEWARRAISGNNNSNTPIKVLFKNLSEIGLEFKDLDALGWQNSDGSLLIFINEKHSNAPIEALGALLCHESIHQDRSNSYKEETYGWTYEAEAWIQLKEKYPNLKTISPGQYPLVDRENLLEMLFRQSNFTDKSISEKVRSNASYKNLPEASPGFGL